MKVVQIDGKLIPYQTDDERDWLEAQNLLSHVIAGVRKTKKEFLEL